MEWLLSLSSTLTGSIYCVGGMDSTGHSLSQVERLNIFNGRMTIEASMNTPRSGVGVAALEGKLYAIGQGIQIYFILILR